MDTQDELLARILDAASRIKKREDQYAMFAHVLQSALKLTVGFSNLYWAL